MKVLRAGSKEAASCPAIISVAGATVDLPPEQWKLLDEDKHPLTARLFDFVTGYLEKEVHEHIRIDATSLKGSCGNLACLFAFDKILAQLDAVAASGSGPQFAKTLNALRHEAYQIAEELAFNLSVDLTRPKHGGEAEGAETGKVQKVATGAQVADHGVHALTGAAGVSNRGGARGGTVVHTDDEGAEDTATKGATRDEADRAVAREGEESSEEEAEAHVVAAATSSRPTTSGKSIKHLAQHLALGAGSAGPSGEVAGKSPVTARMQACSAGRRERTAEETPGVGVGGVAVVGSEELASALANAVWVLEKEARAIAQERAALVDTRNQEALVLRRVDARLGQLQGVVADSMEAAQKKLMDEVAGSSTTCRPRGKGKAEDGEAPVTAGSLASRRDVQSAAAAAAEGRQTTLAPARAVITTGNLHSALASAGPIAASVEVKAEKRGRGGKKLPPPPVYTFDEDKADTELEGLMSRWVEAGDGGEQGGEAAVDVNCARESADEQDGDPVIVEGGTTGGHGDTGPKRRGCGIRAPPRGGPGLVSEPHLGGKKRWLGHADRQDLQYRTAIAMYPCDGKVDPELNLSQQQIREWAADLSIAEGLHMGLLITMHYRNLVASKDRWQRMFDSYRGLTKPGMHTTNVIAWAAVVGKDGAAEEADLGDVEPTDYARAIACAIAMVWEVTRGSNIIAAADNGNLAARAAGCYGERSRLFPVVSAYVINAVWKCNRREH
ncbi:unnamed protein product [Closterium sp. NIES-65]|nr:unnamed protein product [Closterium sp. NIES-65]